MSASKEGSRRIPQLQEEDSSAASSVPALWHDRWLDM